ncbi:MAG: molybdenum cofactor guanylyltransferase [Actinomycetota bacterium]
MDIQAVAHGILLTGGNSSRMAADKARQEVGQVALARRVASALAAAADPVLVVGPHQEFSAHFVCDAGDGPLAAFLTGWEWLVARGHAGPVVLAACDLPFVTAELFMFLAGRLGNSEAVVPLLGGRAQFLAACYSPVVLAELRLIRASGASSMKTLLAELDPVLVAEQEWTAVAPARALLDVDTPAELEQARLWLAEANR